MAAGAGMRADPNCQWCKGTGEVDLFTSSAPCECTKRDNQDPEERTKIIIHRLTKAMKAKRRFGRSGPKVIIGKESVPESLLATTTPRLSRSSPLTTPASA